MYALLCIYTYKTPTFTFVAMTARLALCYGVMTDETAWTQDDFDGERDSAYGDEVDS